jgi:hypothetical protein
MHGTHNITLTHCNMMHGTHNVKFLCSVTPPTPRKSYRLWDNVEVEPDRTQMRINAAHAHYMLGNSGYRKTLSVCHTHCLCTPTRLGTTSHVHCACLVGQYMVSTRLPGTVPILGRAAGARPWPTRDHRYRKMIMNFKYICVWNRGSLGLLQEVHGNRLEDAGVTRVIMLRWRSISLPTRRNLTL